MYCSNCGKELCDNAVICPGCGAATGKPLGAKQESNVLAIVGFVLAFLMPVAGLVCSILGKNRAAELGGSGKGLATAGIAVSIAYLALAVLFLILFFTIFFAALSAAAYL